MHKFFKDLNIFGLAIIMVAGTVIFTQSAFKPAKVTGNVYGYDYTNHKWIAEDQDNYSCIDVDERPCKFDFGSGSPEQNQLPTEVDAEPSDTDFGSYEAR